MARHFLATVVSQDAAFREQYGRLLTETGFKVQFENIPDNASSDSISLNGRCFLLDNREGHFPFSHFIHQINNKQVNVLCIVIGKQVLNESNDSLFFLSLPPEVPNPVIKNVFKNAFVFIKMTQQQSELASMIMHDMRSPLNSLVGYLELIINETFGPLNEGQKKILEKAMELGDSTLEMLEDLNEIFIGEQNSLYIEKRPFDLCRLLEQVLINIWIKADRKNIKIKREIPDNLGFLYGDDYQIMRLLNNLLNNAIKYSPENSQIIIRAIEKGSMAQISIIDNGGGVHPDQLPHLFEKFYRVNTQSAKRNGFGLGLYISQIITRAHGGRIWAENNPQGGLSVHFTIPLAKNTHEQVLQSFC